MSETIAEMILPGTYIEVRSEGLIAWLLSSYAAAKLSMPTSIASYFRVNSPTCR